MKKHIAPGQLAAYMDAELASDEARSVEAHLLVCPRCYEKAMRQSRAKTLLQRSARAGEQAPAVAIELQRGGRARPDAGRPAFMLAVVVLLMFMVVYGVQSLVTDVLARDRQPGDSRTAAFVEDHLSFTNTYQAVY